MIKDFLQKCCNDDLIKFKFLIIICFCIAIIDIFVKFWKCFIEKPAIFILVYIHTIIIFFTYFGWIFNNKYILIFHLLFLVGVMAQWAFNDWRCFVTNVENNVCEFSDYEYSDYFNRLFDKNLAPIIAYPVRILVISIVLYKLIFYKN
jgi:hypothetical protein